LSIDAEGDSIARQRCRFRAASRSINLLPLLALVVSQTTTRRASELFNNLRVSDVIPMTMIKSGGLNMQERRNCAKRHRSGRRQRQPCLISAVRTGEIRDSLPVGSGWPNTVNASAGMPIAHNPSASSMAARPAPALPGPNRSETTRTLLHCSEINTNKSFEKTSLKSLLRQGEI
jgi:hypothetical protein